MSGTLKKEKETKTSVALKRGSTKDVTVAEDKTTRKGGELSVVGRSKLNSFYRICFLIAASPPFNIMITLVIIFNTYILASHHYQLTD